MEGPSTASTDPAVVTVDRSGGAPPRSAMPPVTAGSAYLMFALFGLSIVLAF